MIRVLTFVNRIHGRHQEMYLAYERSLLRKKVPFFVTIEAEPWRWERKVDWEHEMALKYKGDHLVFTDAFDFLFVGHYGELEAIVKKHDLLLSCDAGEKPWPYAGYAPFYEKRRKKESPWCWVNGSGPAGKAEAIAEATADAWSKYSLGPFDTDQTFWTYQYLEGFGELDQRCELTQTLYDPQNPPHFVTEALGHKDGRIINTITGSKPQFLHATGHSWWAIPKELIPPVEEYKP